MKLLIALSAVALLGVALAAEQPKPAPSPAAPTITDADRVAILRVQLDAAQASSAQQKAIADYQQASTRLSDAQARFAPLVEALQKRGCDIDLTSLECKPKPPEPASTPAPPAKPQKE